MMKLILFQGNPGPKYADSRHNLGFMVADAYAMQAGVKFSSKPKFFADLAELSGEDKVLLVKPMTFYNETGRTARTLVDFYKLNPTKDVLIVHDELALPFGTIRTRLGGSDAGNNGIKSLNAAIGPNTARIRFGIWNELRSHQNDIDFVLGRFSAEEAAKLPELLDKTCQLIDSFIAGQFEATTNR